MKRYAKVLAWIVAVVFSLYEVATAVPHAYGYAQRHVYAGQFPFGRFFFVLGFD